MAMHQINPQGGKLAALDPIWDRIRSEAEDIVRRAIAFAATCPYPTLPREPGRVGWGHCRNAELSILLCDDEAIAHVNAQWRGQHKPTNVLSFPAPPLQSAVPDGKIPLGDIAIAYETLAREAEENGGDGAESKAALGQQAQSHQGLLHDKLIGDE